jgi:hypothetical protein
MIFQRCSDVVESRVEHAIFDTESCAGTQLLLQFRNSPGALTFRGTRGLLITTRCDERDLSIDEFDDLSNDHIIASASGKFAALTRAPGSIFRTSHALTTVYAP